MRRAWISLLADVRTNTKVICLLVLMLLANAQFLEVGDIRDGGGCNALNAISKFIFVAAIIIIATSNNLNRTGRCVHALPGRSDYWMFCIMGNANHIVVAQPIVNIGQECATGIIHNRGCSYYTSVTKEHCDTTCNSFHDIYCFINYCKCSDLEESISIH